MDITRGPVRERGGRGRGRGRGVGGGTGGVYIFSQVFLYWYNGKTSKMFENCSVIACWIIQFCAVFIEVAFQQDQDQQ